MHLLLSLSTAKWAVYPIWSKPATASQNILLQEYAYQLAPLSLLVKSLTAFPLSRLMSSSFNKTYQSLGRFSSFCPSLIFPGFSSCCSTCYALPSPLPPSTFHLMLIVGSLPLPHQRACTIAMTMPLSCQCTNANNPTTSPCKSLAVAQLLPSQ